MKTYLCVNPEYDRDKTAVIVMTTESREFLDEKLKKQRDNNRWKVTEVATDKFVSVGLIV